MKIFKTKSDLNKFILDIKDNNKTIGFVPTMGALHEGHLSLVKPSVQQNDITIVSIFVNPTQFDNQEDLQKYPRTLEEDLKLLETVNCNAVFIPSEEDIYDNSIKSSHFDFDGLESQMEGKFRKGHFDGVGTIVKKLFEIVKPDNAYFGEKDFQQLQIIKKLVEKYHIPVTVKGQPIHRENNGLAMSSRNTRLTEKHKEAAPFIYQTLLKAKELFCENGMKVVDWVAREFDSHPLLDLEYFTIADEETLVTPEEVDKSKKYRGFIAVYAGEIRLIDNINLNN